MTAPNPYSPPRADVRDGAPRPLLAERPPQITLAIALLWIALALAFPLTYLDYRRLEPDERSGFVLIAGVFFALAVLINVYIARRRNWARMLNLLLAVLAFGLLPFELPELRQQALGEQALNALAYLLELVVLYLLFTRPGSLWFRFHPQG